MIPIGAIALATFVATAVLGAGCGADDQPPSSASGGLPAILASIPPPFAEQKGTFPQAEGTYVGSAHDGGPYVGIVVEDIEAAVYVCDGRDGQWLSATIDGERLEGTSGAGTVIDAVLDNDRIEGTVSLPGQGPEEFTAAPASNGPAGLYREELASRTLGTIVLENASVRGVTADGQTGKSVGVATAGTTEQPGSSESLEPSEGGGGTAEAGGETGDPPCSTLIPGVCTNLTCDGFTKELQNIYLLYGVNGKECARNKDCRKFQSEIFRIQSRAGLHAFRCGNSLLQL